VNSAIKISYLDTGAGAILGFIHLLTEVWELSKLTGQECDVLLQHSLRNDKMAVSVEFADRFHWRRTNGKVGLYATGKDFSSAVAECISEIREFKKEYGPQQKKEPTPGTKSRQGYRRKRATRKRRS
jgi:hypothetical protein